MSIWIRWRTKNKMAIWAVNAPIVAILLFLCMLVTLGLPLLALLILVLLTVPALLVLLVRWLRHR